MNSLQIWVKRSKTSHHVWMCYDMVLQNLVIQLFATILYLVGALGDRLIEMGLYFCHITNKSKSECTMESIGNAPTTDWTGRAWQTVPLAQCQPDDDLASQSKMSEGIE